MASEKITAMIEEVKTLTVLELAELVHALEEEFGVSAAAAAVAAPAAAPAPVAAPAAAPAPAAAAPVAGEAVTAPMPGNILKVNVTAGQAVKEGDVLVVLEAMKMENEILAPKACTVKQVLVSKGATVDTGATLVVLG